MDRVAAARLERGPWRREVPASVLVESALEQMAEAEEADTLGSCRGSSGLAAIQEGPSGLQQESAVVVGEPRCETPEEDE